MDASGNILKGMFDQEKLTGIGEIRRGNGDLIKGSFYQNEIQDGMIEYADGSTYTGQMKQWKPEGTGEWYSKKANLRFRGTFVDGLLNGFVVVVEPDGKIHEELWENGTFVKVTQFY